MTPSALAWTHAELSGLEGRGAESVERALIADGGRGLCVVVIGDERAPSVLEAWKDRHAPDTAVVHWTGAGASPVGTEQRARLERARVQLAEYAAGERREFDLELDLRGTEFERRVWAGLLEIPFGATRTYGELAEAIGSPGGARAVGGAAGRNPVPIVVPCHRLLASSGLGGFTGGLDKKRALLGLEGHRVERQREFL